MRSANCIVLLLCVLCYSCDSNQASLFDKGIVCSAEQVLDKGVKHYFETSNPNFVLENGEMQSNSFARTGEHCFKLDENNHYGAGIRLYDIQKENFFEIVIWQRVEDLYGSLNAVLEREDGQEYRFSTHFERGGKDKDGWVKHNLAFVAMENFESLKIYVNAGGREAYFDDFELRVLPQAPLNNIEKSLSIHFPDSSYAEFQKHILNSNFKRIIPKSEKKYVNASVLLDTDTLPAKIKLKGDWTDHIANGKPSMRIKLKNGKTYHGLNTFSVQHVKCRNFIDEWIFHKIAEGEDILTTTYDFVNVDVNNMDGGIYAIEEHFTKQLLEKRNRREGPILKLDETGMWSLFKSVSDEKIHDFPFFQESKVDVFGEKRIKKDSLLNMQADEGKRLLQLFKDQKIRIEDVFDVDKMANFYALTDVTAGGHGLRWHNRRFYYNPITQKLEHIAYDIQPFKGEFSSTSQLKDRLLTGTEKLENVFDEHLLNSVLFKERYLFHLERQSKKSYLDSVFAVLDEQIKTNVEAIQGELSTYSFDRNKYYENAAVIHNSLSLVDELWTEILEQKDGNKRETDTLFLPSQQQEFFKDISINAYREKTKEGYVVSIENYHTSPIEIIGYQHDSIKTFFESPLLIAGYSKYSDVQSFAASNKPKKILFRLMSDTNRVFRKKIIAGEKPNGLTTRMVLERRFNPKSDLFSLQGGKVVFSGEVEISEPLLIPSKYEVVIKEGTVLTFVETGGLIVCNSLYAIGTVKNPIEIIGRDSLTNGITVLKGELAHFENVNVDGLSNLSVKNWLLSGAITVYETETILKNVSILNAKAEDALNIVRSKFTIDQTLIYNCFSDGFDADFCEGTITNGVFENIGNDGLDFSGSIINANNIYMKNVGDKGVSAGEATLIHLKAVRINGAVIGLAAKDKSEVVGEEIRIENVNLGIASFQKKPEYGGGSIELTKAFISEFKMDFLVGSNSIIRINNEVYEGDKQVNPERAYKFVK